MHAYRRRALMDQMDDAVAVFFAAPETIRNNDVHHDYRQDSDFWFLTGFEEPESVLVLAPHRDEGDRVVLFLRDRDPEREVWDGHRVGVEAACAELGVDVALPVGALAEKLPDYLKGARRLYYPLGLHPAHDLVVVAALGEARRARKTGIDTPHDVLSPEPALHEMRLVKDELSLGAMRRAAALAAEGHKRAMAATRPGQREYELQAEMEYTWRLAGSSRQAYESIVGSGPNACVLHYRANRRQMDAGDLVLVDAGCEVDYHASDITRTWPVSGRFTEPQRRVYEVVLEAQKASIDQCRAGTPFDAVHETAVRVLTEGMVELGLLTGEVDALIEDESYKRYYMHRTGHWLGMDVHDVGAYYDRGDSRPLRPGMVTTVEPGLYIAPDDQAAPEAFRGIGVRIEDDVLVTSDAPEVLSAGAPKEVSEIEALVGSAAKVGAPGP